VLLFLRQAFTITQQPTQLGSFTYIFTDYQLVICNLVHIINSTEVVHSVMGAIMHSAARGARGLFGLFVALAFLGCVFTVLDAAGVASSPEPTVAAADHVELLRLAEQAKAAFRRRMEPPPIQIPVLTIFERDRTAIVRDYARDSYEAAVDALVAEARTPERARAVKAALRQLVNTGRADLAEAIFRRCRSARRRKATTPSATRRRQRVTASRLLSYRGPLRT
jgi:hypothetical protein